MMIRLLIAVAAAAVDAAADAAVVVGAAVDGDGYDVGDAAAASDGVRDWST